MIISRVVAEGIAAGTVTVLYRRWARQRVRAGSRLVTSAGVVEFTAVEAVDPSAVTPADEVEKIRTRLSTMDKRGPWTRATLDLIAASPGRRAGDLAEMLGRDKAELKVGIRMLKSMGLTLSLETGYRISPRGDAYLRALENS